MAQASKQQIRNIIDSLNIVDEKVEVLIEQLLEQDELTQQLIQNREMAKKAGDHDRFAQLDESLLSSLTMVENLEREVVAQLNKEIDFEKLENDKKTEFMINENAEKTLENDLLKFRASNTRDEYILAYNGKKDKLNSLIDEKTEMESELAELENSKNPDKLAIGRKKRDIEAIEKKMKELQKEIEKMKEVFKLNIDEFDRIIENNNRSIKNNLRNLDIKNITPNNYSKASQLVSDMYSTRKRENDLFPMASNYAPFKDIMTAEEFKYLAKEYENEQGKPLIFNKNANTGFIYKLLHKRDIEQSLRARYPHLAAKENRAELKRMASEQGDALAIMLQSGITGQMLRNLHRDIQSDVRYYQSKSDRGEWLKSLKIQQSGPDVELNQENNQPQQQNNQPEVEQTNNEANPTNRTAVNQRLEIDPNVMDDKTRQSTFDEFNDPIEILDGIEKLGIDSKTITKLRKDNINSIGELIEALNKNGIELSIKQKDKDVDKKSTDKKNPTENGKTVKGNKEETKENGTTPKKSKKEMGIDINNVPFSKVMMNRLEGQGIKTVQQLISKLENGEKVEGFNQNGYKDLRQFCRNNSLDANINWEQSIAELKKQKGEKPEEKKPKGVKKTNQVKPKTTSKGKSKKATKDVDNKEGIFSDRNILYNNDDVIQKYSHDDNDRDDR